MMRLESRSMRMVGMIPARYGSTRFPAKPLASIKGKPMIQHVYERAKQIAALSEVYVVTDHVDIATAIYDIGGRVRYVHSNYPTGTDAIASVVPTLDKVSTIVNIQGDLPVFDPEMVTQTIDTYRYGSTPMTTLATPIVDRAELENRNIVKVVTDIGGYALYFSRAPIPYSHSAEICAHRHIGLYVYDRDFLMEFVKLKQTPLEKMEKLEQLRALENDVDISVAITTKPTVEVDVPEDIIRAERAIGEGW